MNDGEDYGEQGGHEEHGGEQGREEQELVRQKEETRLAPKATVGFKGSAVRRIPASARGCRAGVVFARAVHRVSGLRNQGAYRRGCSSSRS